jgi:Fe-S cluster biosynthesis and repair protein YggX
MAEQTTPFTCGRCGLPNPRLAEAPLDTPLGRKIGETICSPCWREWMDYSTKVINEYRLILSSPEGAQIYDDQMRDYLGIRDEAQGKS